MDDNDDDSELSKFSENITKDNIENFKKKVCSECEFNNTSYCEQPSKEDIIQCMMANYTPDTESEDNPDELDQIIINFIAKYCPKAKYTRVTESEDKCDDIEFVNCYLCGAEYPMHTSTGEIDGCMIKTSDGKYVCEEHIPPSSQLHKVYWLTAGRIMGKYPNRTTRTGKWLIFCDKGHIDVVWDKVKQATQEGSLGNLAKVSTPAEKSSELGYRKGSHVICVYTYDYEDIADVRRIMCELLKIDIIEGLRKVGIIDELRYKTDEDTLLGKYKATGHKNISKYTERDFRC